MVWVKINYKQNLGINEDKAKDLFKQYHNRVYHLLKQLMDSVMSKASRNGRVRTWLG